MQNAGIDYGMGLVNIDKKNGIRYGVIHSGELGQSWYDDSNPVYPECECGQEDCECDAIEFTYEKDGYAMSQSADDPDIFVVKSPFYTYAKLCSPCAPGAGYLMNFTTPDNGIKAYAPGHDWFESGAAPYPVYSVKTNELVKGG